LQYDAHVRRFGAENPETVRVAIASNAMFEALAEQIELVSGAKFIKVPFGGDAPARQALLGNHIDVSFGFIGSARGEIESGSLKIIAVTGIPGWPSTRIPPSTKS
jgi:tripartite-type tricarboxylate transporter receptor subunit TctC